MKLERRIANISEDRNVMSENKPTLASLSAARVAYMLGWRAMFCMLVALGRVQREVDTLGKATRLDGGHCFVAMTESRGESTKDARLREKGSYLSAFYRRGHMEQPKGRVALESKQIWPLVTVNWPDQSYPCTCGSL